MAVHSHSRARSAGGPLSPFEAALRAELARQGYTPGSARAVMEAMRRLSCWMEQRDVPAAGLGPQVVEEFLADRRAIAPAGKAARRGLGPLLRVLRAQGAIPPAAGEASSPAGQVLARYRDYLNGERGLAAESVRCYLVQGRKLLDELGEPLDAALRQLNAAAVTSFIMRQSRQAASTWSAKTLVTATRSLLRFLHVEGLIPAPLAAAVPAVAGWRLAALPRGLAPELVQAVLAGPDTATAVGLRDRAVLMLLARLGLRGAEAAALRLGDVGWHDGDLLIRGKGSAVERIPLPADAGEALAAYLMGGRPACSCPALFVTARAPYKELTPAAVRAIMGRACAAAGLPRVGAHRLRHSLATGLLRAGAPLTEVGQLLRHRSQLSTSVYAKVDYAALRTLARPWPIPEGGLS
jgi:integrase/recombinase XerD